MGLDISWLCAVFEIVNSHKIWSFKKRGDTRVTSTTLLAGAAVLLAPQCGASQCGVYGTDGLGWSHPHKENSNWKR
ncbi:hypothetical protein AAY473_013995 [Plecturocebus cupreus]